MEGGACEAGLCTTPSTWTYPSSQAEGGGFSIARLLCEARHRWLKGHEVYHILRSYRAQGYTHNADVVRCPPSGSVFLFRPKVTKYRIDGVNWRRRDSNRLQEGHEKLKVDGVEVIRCCYVQSEDNPSFHRRVYSLLDGSDTTVLVHYLDEKTTPTRSSIGGQSPSPSLPSHPSYASSSLRPPSSIYATPCSGSAPFRPIIPLPTCLPTQSIRSTASFVESSTVQQHAVVNASDWELDEELMAIVADQTFNSAPLPGSPYTNTRAESSSLAIINDLSPEWDYVTGGSKVLLTGNFPSLSPGSPFEGLKFTCMFDNILVPADVVQAGVLRCFSPSHTAGMVPLCITFGDHTPISNSMQFEYRELLVMEMKDQPHMQSPSSDEAFRSGVLSRLAALQNRRLVVPSPQIAAAISSAEAEQADSNDSDYQKLLEAFSILVKLESGRDKGTADNQQEREEEAALLIQSTFRSYRLKKRNEAAKKIQKLYRKRYALRNGAATTIQAAFRSYKQKKFMLRLKSQTQAEDERN